MRDNRATSIAEDGYVVRDDTARNLIIVAGQGFVEAWQIDETFEVTRRLIGERRARNLPVRILVDNRRVLIHSPETAERLRLGAERHRPGDRVAIIAQSSLARIQLRRTLDMSIHRLFASEDEAVAWLLEEEPA